MGLRSAMCVNLASGTFTLTNQPAALTEFPAGATWTRLRIDLSDFDSFRLSARVITAGFAGATLGLQYSTDNEATWLPNGSLAGAVAIDSTGAKLGSLVSLPANAKAEVVIRIAALGGNATADPVIGNIAVQLFSEFPVESPGLWDQLKSECYRLANNYRDNATAYKAKITAGVPAATVAAEMVADANAFEVRIAKVTNLVTNNLAAVQNALRYGGWTLTVLTSTRDTLQAACDHVQAATLTTGAQVNTESDWLLANVPTYPKMW